MRIEAPKATDVDTEAEVKEWLTFAAERDGARKERNGSTESCTSLRGGAGRISGEIFFY